MQIQTVFRAGNSDVVALPKNLGFKKGDKVVVEQASEGGKVVIEKVSTKKAGTSDAEFKKWLREALVEDAEILDELADR